MVATAGYAVVLMVYGYGVATRFLHLHRLLEIVGVTTIFGTASYLVVANALSYLAPVSVSFPLALLLLFSLGAGLILATPRRALLVHSEMPPCSVLVVVLGLTALGGFANARILGSDPWGWTHFPLAATIAEGNFPVVEPIEPWLRIGYHYGPAFLAAAFSSVTGLSLNTGYALQPLLSIAAILLFAGSIAWRITRSWRSVLVGSASALLGSGLGWLKGEALLRDLYQHFALGQHLAGPFRGLVPIFDHAYGSPLIYATSHRPIALGHAFLYALLFCLLQGHQPMPRSQTMRWGVVSVVLALALALTLEQAFVVLIGAAVLYCGILYVIERSDMVGDQAWRRGASFTICVLFTSLLIAIVQGGILSSPARDVGYSSFRIGFDGLLHLKSMESVWLWEWPVLRDYGFPFLSLLVSLAYFWRRRLCLPTLLLCTIALLHFVLPLFVDFLPRITEMNRLFYTAISLSSFLLGVLLSETLLHHPSRYLRLLGLGLTAALLLSGAVYLPLRTVFPTFRVERSPLFARMPEVSPERKALYDWVRHHTSINDYFYIRTINDELDPQLDRILFMTHAARYTIGPLMWRFSFTDEQLSLLESIEQQCDHSHFRELSIRYLIVENRDRAAWFEQHCDTSEWILRYSTGSIAYPRVYEIVPLPLSTPTAPVPIS